MSGPGDRRDAAVPALDEVLGRLASAAHVVDVDVVVALALAHGPAAVDDRHGRRDAVDEEVARVVRDDDRAVDAAAADVAGRLVARVIARDEEVEHVVGATHPRVDARDDRGEERVAEEPRGVFGHDERDRVRLAARERARGAVGHVVQLVDRALDRLERGRADGGRAVHDARDRRPRHTGGRRDLFDRGGPAASCACSCR